MGQVSEVTRQNRAFAKLNRLRAKAKAMEEAWERAGERYTDRRAKLADEIAAAEREFNGTGGPTDDAD